MTRLVPSLPLIVAVAAILLSSGCSDSADVVRYKTPKPEVKTEVSATEAQSQQTEEIVWEKPEGWIDGRASAMRMASFAIPYDGGGAADISLTKLGGVAGGVLANINRWRGQVGLDPITVEQLANSTEIRQSGNGRDYIYLELENEEQGQAIYAAIYESRDFSVFAKMTASLEIAKASREEFKQFCDSVAVRD